MAEPCCNRWLQTIQHSFDGVVLLDRQARVIGWNAQAERCFGWQAHEILGKVLTDTILAPLSVEIFSRDWASMLTSGEASTERRILLNIGAVHRTGHALTIEMSLTCGNAGAQWECVAFIRDVTERHDADNALRIASVAFQSLEGMVIMDANQVILRVNQAFTEITGYEEDEAVGRVSAIFREGRQDEEVYLELRRALPEKRFWQGEVWDRRKNGERYCVWLRVTAVAGSASEVNHYVGAFVDISSQRASAQRVHYLDFHDPLTCLPNRRFFLDRLRQAIAACERKHECCAVLLIDLDDFKSINDTLGHSAGDTLLVKIGKRLRMSLHTEDTIARLGGDEFAVILQGLTGTIDTVAAKARTVGERLVHALGQHFHIAQAELAVSLSIGVSVSDCQHGSAEDLLKEADIAMYRAKHDGRNCIRFFDAANQLLLESRFALTAALRSGFPQQFHVHYQLQVDKQLAPVGAEALVRWAHPTNGAIAPGSFIPLAEETGFIVPLGAWVLGQACAQLSAWANNHATRGLTLAVNVSARQFHADSFVSTVLEALRHSGANPNLLKLELTEGIMLNQVETAVQKMNVLHNLGIRFSLDDFGTGYSSLSYLKQLPLEQLKIDQTFVRDIETDTNDVAIASTIVAMGKALGMHVVAEGVETGQQLEILRAMGCHAFQGYYIARPVSATVLTQQLISPNHRPPSRVVKHEFSIPEAL